MIQNGVILAPQVKLETFRNLFIELTSNTCDLKCKHCYINQSNKKEKDFISLETIISALKDLKNEKIEMIYFTGTEPMLHPEFNAILRLCLKFTPVTIFTNAMCINEKKARFLNKVENEGNNPIIFRISIDHFDERKNDDIRGRGAFRKAIHAIAALIKYDFNPYINITNYYNIPEEELIKKFLIILNNLDIDLQQENLIINPWFDKNIKSDSLNGNSINTDYTILDCASSRTLNKYGVYSCPFLASDHRGRMGANFKDFSRKTYLESQMCAQCQKYNRKIFVN